MSEILPRGISYWLIGLGGLLLSWNCALAGPAMPPDQVIRLTADEVIATLKTDKAIQSGDRAKAYTLIQDKVIPHFDFVRMTRLSMGRSWKQASPAQQEQLVAGFRDLLVRTYSSSLSQYKNQTIQVKSAELRSGETEATVHTRLIPEGGQDIPIDYSMDQVEGEWKIYDIRVEGVSLVTNYRGEFNDIVNRSGIEGLLQALEEKRRAAAKK